MLQIVRVRANPRVKYVLEKLGILGTDLTFQRYHGEDFRLRSRSLTSYTIFDL